MTEHPAMPTPDPALAALDRLVGTWELTGRLAGSEEDTITGRATFRWLPGGFFLEQRISLDFMGMAIESTELVGHDAETGSLESTVYSNMSPVPLPYHWSVDGDTVRISVQHGPLDATFTGTWNGDSMSGGWRPNEGADQTVNVPYDLRGVRVG